jgi:hypothetical protein
MNATRSALSILVFLGLLSCRGTGVAADTLAAVDKGAPTGVDPGQDDSGGVLPKGTFVMPDGLLPESPQQISDVRFGAGALLVQIEKANVWTPFVPQVGQVAGPAEIGGKVTVRILGGEGYTFTKERVYARTGLNASVNRQDFQLLVNSFDPYCSPYVRMVNPVDNSDIAAENSTEVPSLGLWFNSCYWAFGAETRVGATEPWSFSPKPGERWLVGLAASASTDPRFEVVVNRVPLFSFYRVSDSDMVDVSRLGGERQAAVVLAEFLSKAQLTPVSAEQ